VGSEVGCAVSIATSVEIPAGSPAVGVADPEAGTVGVAVEHADKKQQINTEVRYL